MNDASADSRIASVNGIALHAAGVTVALDELRQRACTELLRQAAQACGLLDAADAPSLDGVVSEAASLAIERLLEREAVVPEPSEEACRRHYAANEGTYRVGERIRARHILMAVTPGVDVVALRGRAESILLDVRCHKEPESEYFAQAARKWSNCPSGAEGGDLGWLTAQDCAPEFARELFGKVEVGVLPRLVHSRFGLHVVEVLERHSDSVQAFETVRAAVAASLTRQAYITTLRQYLQVLAGNAVIEGIELEGTDTPLVQ
jgi:peptidyl-prolyl cis-trans isomerase C